MDISVITTVYNKEEILLENIAHTLSQKDIKFEFVLVDEKSPDSCPSMLDALADEHSNVRVIHRAQNGGHVEAYNTGILAAKGDYIILVDADDYLNYDYALHDMLEIAKKTDADAVLSDFTGHYNKSSRKVPYIGSGRAYLMQMLEAGFYHPTTRGRLFKMSVFKDNLLQNYIIDDEEWTLRTLFELEKIAVYARKIYTRTTPSNSVTQTISESNYYRKSRDRFLATEKMACYFNGVALSEKERTLIYTRIVNLYMMAINIRITKITNTEYKHDLDTLLEDSCSLLNYSKYVEKKVYCYFNFLRKIVGIKPAMKLYSCILRLRKNFYISEVQNNE